MRTTLVTRDSVNLVEDHRAQLAEGCTSTRRCQEDEQRLRRRDQDVRRLLRHLRALAGWRVARANADANVGELVPAERRASCELRQRGLEVSMDVVRQRLER